VEESPSSELEGIILELEDRIAQQRAMVRAMDQHRSEFLTKDPKWYKEFGTLVHETLASLEASLLAARERLVSEQSQQDG